MNENRISIEFTTALVKAVNKAIQSAEGEKNQAGRAENPA